MVAEPSTVNKPESREPQRSPGWGVGLLILIFRLLLLGVGGVAAGLIGISIAQVVPGTIQEPPLLERALRLGISLRRGSSSVPQPLRLPDEVDSSPSAATDELRETDAPPASSNPSSQVSSAREQQIQPEIDRLQSELAELGDRTTELESQLGVDTEMTSAETTSLEVRLQNLEQLAASDSSPSSSASVPSASVNDAVVSQNGELRMTLPGDALFASDGETLGASSSAILDAIVSEIRPYPGSAIQVAGLIETSGNIERDRVLAFRQADVVKQYLERELADQPYHWVVVGYGQNLPREGQSTAAGESPNGRIEISIVP